MPEKKPKLCPRCQRPGRKAYKYYCSKVHYKLEHTKPRKLAIPCASCGVIQMRNPSQISASGNVYCRVCKKASGEDHPKWREGQYLNSEGYRLVLVKGSYLREHRVVWETANKACLIPGALGAIHHIDYDKLNNTPDNLLLLSNEEHGRFHRLFDAGRLSEAGCILRAARDRQAYHPANVETFIETQCN